MAEVDAKELASKLAALTEEQIAALPPDLLGELSRALRHAHGNLAAEHRRRGERSGNGFNPQMPSE